MSSVGRGGSRAVASMVFALLAGAVRIGSAEPGLPAPLLDAASDQVHARVAVPEDIRRVGSVRLVTRGRAVVVQTVLATKVLGRVVDEIAQKERDNWPADHPEVAGRVRYVDAVTAAARKLEADRDATPRRDRRLRLVIELVASDDAAGLVLATFAGDADDPAQGRTILETTALPRAYVLRNVRLILADAFDRAERDVDTLGPLGPATRR